MEGVHFNRERAVRLRKIRRGFGSAPWAAVAVFALVSMGGAKCGADSPLKYPHVQASGRPAHCDQQPMTNPNGIATPDAVRCSYEDGIGPGSARLQGSVYGEGESSVSSVALEGVVVTVHKLRGASSPGDVVGRATSDAQGHYSLSAMLPEGDYLVVARDVEGTELARAPLRTTNSSESQLKVNLHVPLDPAIRDAMRASKAPSGAEREGEATPATPTPTPAQREALPPPEALPLAPRSSEPMSPAKPDAR